MSSAQIILFANWVFSKNILTKLKAFFANKPAIIFSAIFLLHVLGLLYTSDFDYAFKDLRTKIPIILLPLIISTSPLLNEKKFRLVLSFFVGGVLFASITCYYIYLAHVYNDIRQISIFISHIRFSLDICLAICILAYYLYDELRFSTKRKWILIGFICWLVYFLFVLQSITGIIILFCLFLSLLLYFTFTLKKKKYKIVTLFLFIIIPFFVLLYIRSAVHSYFRVEKYSNTRLEQYTSRGNLYIHDTINSGVENGSHIGIYVCQDELKKSWAERSKINIDSNDRMGQHISFTLIRFLNSKGLRKDADGVNTLTESEIKAIENGVANTMYIQHPGLQARLYKLLFEYNSYMISRNTRGHSVFQRFELWKAAIGIIKNNFWFGVGTGDMVTVYDKQLIDMKSDLAGQKLRAHNQYLSIFSAFGIIGFLIFMFALIYPAILNHSFKDFYFLSFFIILFLSMINEDTIESQAGVSFFALFYSFFLLSRTITTNPK
jgi:O-antigen ligase